jgi:hypothetical protein
MNIAQIVPIYLSNTWNEFIIPITGTFHFILYMQGLWIWTLKTE